MNKAAWVERAAAAIRATHMGIGYQDSRDMAAALAEREDWEGMQPETAVDEAYGRDGVAVNRPVGFGRRKFRALIARGNGGLAQAGWLRRAR